MTTFNETLFYIYYLYTYLFCGCPYQKKVSKIDVITTGRLTKIEGKLVLVVQQYTTH